jgi:hypothetical protein
MEDHLSPSLQSSSNTASLDSLPTELKVAIITNVRDLQTLNCLIKASPSYHNIYLSQRQNFLTKALVGAVDPRIDYVARGILVDSDWASLQRDERIDIVNDYLRPATRISHSRGYWHYRSVEPWHQRTTALNPGWLPDAHLALVVKAARTHTIITRVKDNYCASIRLANPMSIKLDKLRGLSAAEETRFLRGFYNFELMCSLYGSRYSGSAWQQGNRDPFTEQQAVQNFLSAMKVWEVEEINCIYEYLINYYAGIFEKQLKDFVDLDVRVDRTRRRTGMDRRTYKLSTSHSCFLILPLSRLNAHINTATNGPSGSIIPPWGPPLERKYEHWALLGLEFFYKLITAPNRTSQVEILRENYVEKWEFSITNALNIYHRTHLQSSHIDTYTTCDIDRAVNEDGPENVRVADVLRSSRYDLCIFDVPESTRSWGYVFWDRERLREWGVLSKDIRNVGLDPAIERKEPRVAVERKDITEPAKKSRWTLKNLVKKEKNVPR